jgi:hypothetical protein
LDKYLAKDNRLPYVVSTNRNEYIPTYNSKISELLTDDAHYNAKNNRTKRLFNKQSSLAMQTPTPQKPAAAEILRVNDLSLKP